MKKEKSVKIKIESLVYKGLLPMGFLNSEVFEINNKKTIKPKRNRFYNQIEVPKGHSETPISKIYELL